eukprot:GHVT01098614.1.p1 GENE.GHVT01098614.1~~GHVT01098614.1.p1  ORF type:complete len:156 (+),score=10.35 GHVT01098614.1:469-936(+)
MHSTGAAVELKERKTFPFPARTGRKTERPSIGDCRGSQWLNSPWPGELLLVSVQHHPVAGHDLPGCPYLRLAQTLYHHHYCSCCYYWDLALTTARATNGTGLGTIPLIRATVELIVTCAHAWQYRWCDASPSRFACGGAVAQVGFALLTRVEVAS